MHHEIGAAVNAVAKTVAGMVCGSVVLALLATAWADHEQVEETADQVRVLKKKHRKDRQTLRQTAENLEKLSELIVIQTEEAETGSED